jgi:hypothetical protein
MRLRSGIRCDAFAAVLLALAALLAFVPASRAAPPTEAPADLHVIYSDAWVIGVAWTPAADPLVGTQVTWGRAGSSDPPTVITTGPAHEWWLDVRCGQELSISVALQNADGAGPPATVTAASDPCDPGPPDQPAVEVSAVHGGSVELAWPDPVANDVAFADVTVTEPGTGFTHTSQVSGLGAVMAGLRCGTAYDLAVTFVDYDDHRSAAATTHVTTVACDKLGPAPDAPGNLRIVETVGLLVTLAWDPSPRPGGVVNTYVTLAAGSSSTGIGTQATMLMPGCGDQLATVTMLYTDGRVSKPATLTVPGRRCQPLPPRTLGPIPYHRAGITLHRQAKVTVARNGAFAFAGDTVQCPAVGGLCRVTVRVEARIPGKRGLGPVVVLGQADTTLTPQFVWTVAGRLSARGRALMRRDGRLRVAVTIEAWHVAGLYAVTKHTTFVPARR